MPACRAAVQRLALAVLAAFAIAIPALAATPLQIGT